MALTSVTANQRSDSDKFQGSIAKQDLRYKLKELRVLQHHHFCSVNH
jgi:hypothetical protein